MSSVPFTRTLPYVLRQQLQPRDGNVRALVGKVTAIPDPGHVTVELSGATVTVPRLASYTPAVGQPAYCLVTDSFVLALGTVS